VKLTTTKNKIQNLLMELLNTIYGYVLVATKYGGALSFFSYYIQHCFICRPSDSMVPTDAGIEPRTVATGALAVRRSNHYLFAGILFLLILPVLLILRVLYITQYC
jgi:hypothetical protein